MNFLITQRHALDNRNAWIDSLENAYVSFFNAADCTLFPVPNLCRDVSSFLRLIAPRGIILTGGGDVSPQLYGGTSVKGEQVSPDRDRIETALLDCAISEKIPVLGICRGMQFINVYFGGALDNDISTCGDFGTPLIGNHQVLLEDDTLAKLHGSASATVNSYHTQGVPLNALGRDLDVFARCPLRDIAEGIRHRKLPIAGVQWHPERNYEPARLDRLLIDAFINRDLFWGDHH